MTPRVEIEVIGAQGSVRLSALLDTGFDGEICLPTYLGVTLGLVVRGQYLMEYADGRQEFAPVYEGSVQFLGETRPAEIILTDGGEPMVGTGLLVGHTLFMDFDTGEIRIEKKQS